MRLELILNVVIKWYTDGVMVSNISNSGVMTTYRHEPDGGAGRAALLDYVSVDELLKDPFRGVLRDDVIGLIREMGGLPLEEYLSYCPCCIEDANPSDGWTFPEKSGHEGGDLELGQDTDLATAVDHWWNSPDKGMDQYGNPCPSNQGS